MIVDAQQSPDNLPDRRPSLRHHSNQTCSRMNGMIMTPRAFSINPMVCVIHSAGLQTSRFFDDAAA
jgi:hypothetical protein